MTQTITAQKGLSGALAVARDRYVAGDYCGAISLCESGLANNATQTERLGLLLLKAYCESEIGEYEHSLETLKIAGPLIDDAGAGHRAKFHGQRAYARVKMGRQDESLVDYEAARFWAQEACDVTTEATVRNNLAKVYSGLGRFGEAVDESDSAIGIAVRLNDPILLGRFYDQRARILNEHGQHNEALSFSEKALRLLVHHPTVAEARMTHGTALIGIGKSYLDGPDMVENFRIRRSIVNSIDISLDAQTLQMALDRCAGNVQRAAKVLNVKHPALLKAVKKFGLASHQRKHLHRSIIKK